ncbi:MAG: cyanoexosortase A [Spirulina sp. DLM2.Bin59]|nr:MAG: cyanoexosortase A [Spirulina sp. DLM2.Bin59]
MLDSFKRNDTLKLALDSRYWLLALAAGLMLFHLALTDQTGDMKGFSISLIFWGAIASMVWDKQETLRFRTSLSASLFATTLLILTFWKILQISSGGIFVQAVPLIFGFSLALIASSWRGLGQYRKELLAFAVLALPGERFLAGNIESLVQSITGYSFTMLTAAAATFGLNLVGIRTFLDNGVYMHLSRSIVRVHEGCSGAGIIDFLLRLSFLFLIIFTTTRLGKYLAPVIAILLGFLVNSFRVAVMAYLINDFNTETFDYWHVGSGSQIFGAIGVILFGLICFPFIKSESSQPAAEPPVDHGT